MMLRQSLTSVLIAFVVAASGLGGAALHLCGMEGAVRSSCCCHQTGHEQPPVQIKRVDECCGALLPQGEHPLALTTHDVSVDSSPQVATGTVSLELRMAAHGNACVLPPARGPPPRHGSPLFIQYCSFLI